MTEKPAYEKLEQRIRALEGEEAAQRESEGQVEAKPDSFPSIKGDIGAIDLADILDTEAVQKIMDYFYRLTNIGVAIVNMKGQIMMTTGWQDICTQFHRVHPETRKNCIESDLELSSGVEPGKFKIYRCKNNLWDIATPIVVEGRQLGNLFLGQFFFDDETPDYDAFKAQARRYGFDETDYLEALNRVPRWSRETVDAVMNFYVRFAGLISTLSYSNLKLARALEERGQLLSAIEQVNEAIVITDNNGNIQYVNPAFKRVTGYTVEEVKGKNPRILKSGVQDEAFYQDLWQNITVGKTWKNRIVNQRKDGSRYTEDVSISPVLNEEGVIANFVAVKRDVTSEMELEKRLNQAQKMESIGNLAGGIAHDFNNILSPILLHTEMAMMDLPPDSPLQMNMKQIYKSGERARDLVQQILTFARIKEKKMIPLKASLIVKEAVKFMRATLPSTIDICYELGTDRDTVLADPTQMHQIVMNLCTNAAHAMREKGGELKVLLTEASMGPEETGGLGDIVPGDFLRISVSDTGSGIPSNVIDKIFEPYYTTKEQGQGTGLGLAVIHGIVKSCGGHIAVDSEVNKGSVFHVYLPIVDAEVFLTRESSADLPGGTERILFVDDEKAAVIAIQPMLERLGYRVTAKTESMEALDLFREAPEAFDLVITDQTMPHITGRELARELMAVRPDIPIILCTGFSEQINEKSAREMGIREFVPKPIVMQAMAHAIRKALE